MHTINKAAKEAEEKTWTRAAKKGKMVAAAPSLSQESCGEERSCHGLG